MRRWVFVVGALVVAVVGACSSSSTDEAPIKLPERVPSTDAGDAASASDAPAGDAATVDAASSTCTNGKKDDAETDVDCGGPNCVPCANGRACVANRDCTALVCTGSKCNGDIGCADATREGFTAVATFPNIAACSGGWSVPGVIAPATKLPACMRGSGNDGVIATGSGCNVADLCQVGWHVCETPAEVATKSGGAGCAAAATVGQFFVTRQSGAGAAQCGAGSNDLFGCGGLGIAPDTATCAPLSSFSADLCASLGGAWACGADGFQEANNVTHTSSADGGALCCRD